MNIGFIGLGAMGLPMAVNLVKAGHEVTAFDFNERALKAFAGHGGLVAGSAAEAAKAADFFVLMVVNGDQADDVLFGAGKAVEKLPSGACVIASCTQPPAQARALGDKLGQHQLTLVDAPVSGGVGGAETGTLTIMSSCPAHVFEKAKPVLDVVGRNVFHVGEDHGAGSTAKLVNQLLCGVHIAAAAEALQLAEAAGVDPKSVFDIVSVSAASSWMLNDRGPRMLEDDPEVRSAVDIFVKDLGIVLDHGRAARHGLPLSAAAHQMFLAASGAGLGRADDSQVIQSYRGLNAKADKKD
ncbi:NAD(P)-binding domain-containing protein [Anderseniella sp. Alg231-50]|uniref:NAD(P)-binding domain-containing protein n=1 Tax=Anderseniella sp. Alg231-50 TaxID=1922226 RepID=UPI000D54D25D